MTEAPPAAESAATGGHDPTAPASPDGVRLRAREAGLCAALRMLSDGAGAGIPQGPGGHVVALDRPGVPQAATELRLDGGTLTFGAAPQGLEGNPPAPPAWTAGLAWLRLGCSERLLASCLGYLGERTAGGSPLLVQQMVRGQLAEVRGSQLEAELVLGAGAGPDVLQDVHEALTRADRVLCRLLGASSVLESGPGQEAYASELLADVYTPAPFQRTREAAL
ncbi:hypothetical protein [Streptomonospora litoralis]|uniref:Acyl-CoA dehydrogenase/oxidase C-terminal domain-containing protein n=1 Tax=Streptomonospora litoralis TaxID=2498135 RepID=A0A4P6PWY4_9ACTN|nr:hypothetical protein [Streptomonospora litoralis]QBI52625.1 hypothetical protein EKD16_04075 [Streptomonospora litoralis]